MTPVPRKLCIVQHGLRPTVSKSKCLHNQIALKPSLEKEHKAIRLARQVTQLTPTQNESSVYVTKTHSKRKNRTRHVFKIPRLAKRAVEHSHQICYNSELYIMRCLIPRVQLLNDVIETAINKKIDLPPSCSQIEGIMQRESEFQSLHSQKSSSDPLE